ncbi:O-acetyl-ADP-ribose deacetylase [bacterium]|nr:MAG: O-acetyl-ADP-ribose deacetylase [bacterium]
MEIHINHTTISLKRGDITKEDADAIVNAANSRLAGGGGVDGAIHKAGGPEIMDECNKIGKCEPGNAVITTGGMLKARYVIHAVGPVYKDGNHNEENILSAAYESCLRLAVSRGIETIAFPSISTGAYGYPTEAASIVALKTVLNHLKNNGHGLKLIRFVLFSDVDLEIYRHSLNKLVASQN